MRAYVIRRVLLLIPTFFLLAILVFLSLLRPEPVGELIAGRLPTTTMMLEVLRQDYIRTAWAKGLRERLVILRHVIKNALIPVVTLVGLQVPIIVGGAVIMEQMFAIPGLGRLMIDALFDRDYPLISGINLFFADYRRC